MLDSTERIRELDSRGMLRMVADLPNHLDVGNKTGLSAEIRDMAFKEVVVCGLGGSAIAGDLAASWLSGTSDLPLSVSRAYSLPAHVGPDSLVIAVSYSGDTEETLSMVEDAVERKAELVAVSSGGELRRVASENGIPHCSVPSGLVPRATVGYIFGTLSGILKNAKIAEAGVQLDETRTALSRLAVDCGPDAPTASNPAKKLAHSLHGTVPVVVGHGLTGPVATRWADQFSENAKMVAFSSELPEMNHNSIVGWMGDPRSQGFSMVFLEHDLCDAAMARRITATKRMVSERLRVYSSVASGSSPMAKMFTLVMMGDYTSIYSAFLRGEDPSTTAPIDALKAILSEEAE